MVLFPRETALVLSNFEMDCVALPCPGHSTSAQLPWGRAEFTNRFYLLHLGKWCQHIELKTSVLVMIL